MLPLPVLRALALLAVTLLPALWPAGGVRAATAEVHLIDDAFRDAVIRIESGTTVVWRNTGRNVHTVTADDGSWDSGFLEPGAVFEHTFTEPGRYPYHCQPHGHEGGHGMAGVVLVGDVGDEPAQGRAIAFPPPEGGRTLRVPQDAPTIQAAVDAARPGDLILIAPGVYPEEVTVVTPYLTLRGLDRNRVILEGDFRRQNAVKVLGADGVVIENMTARHYLRNGFYWTGVRGYRGSYLTAYNNADYGIYAFDSVYGQFDHGYASGHRDSGFYIGQCKPCHAVITDVVAENNALGYSGTNAGGNLTLLNSVWRHNMAGIVPNTLDSQRLAPQDGTRIVNNDVYSNHNAGAPAARLQYPAFGNGIVLTGGINNVVEGNRVWDHPNYGILVVPNLDRHLWIAAGHRIRHNTVWGSGRADLALAFPAGSGTCFAGNRHRHARPGAVEWLYGCGSLLSRLGGGDPAPTGVLLRRFFQAMRGNYPSGDWRSQPEPPEQPGMPDPLAPPRPAWPTPESEALPGEVTAPAPPADVAGVPPLRRGGLALGFELFATALPWLVYLVWVGAAVWDLLRHREGGMRPVGAGRKVAWLAAVLLLPVAGPVAYFSLARSHLSRPVRVGLTVGGAGLYLLVLLAARTVF